MKQNDEQYILKIEDLSKQFSQKTIFSAININISKGEIVALLGPSGCGKSTLLRMICGLESVEVGSISFSDDEAMDSEVANIHRSVGLIFQKPVLFPHLSVAGNIILGMSKPPSRKLRNEVAEKYLEDVGLSGFSKNSVETLSGGEAQRVCLVRALISEPKLLLLDEPFSSLDVKSRRKIAIETKQILKKKGISALHVTHDPEEAKLISDRVIKWEDLVN
ncbi:MAG: ABC transporter ATP-binding protein [Candidatus Poseidoniaceae archaeon]|nr:ABC transporter ATP-binding protein [Candidatus Poseidoniaceae archaeon]